MFTREDRALVVDLIGLARELKDLETSGIRTSLQEIKTILTELKGGNQTEINKLAGELKTERSGIEQAVQENQPKG